MSQEPLPPLPEVAARAGQPTNLRSPRARYNTASRDQRSENVWQRIAVLVQGLRRGMHLGSCHTYTLPSAMTTSFVHELLLSQVS